MKKLLTDYTQYNIWANQRIFNAVKSAGEQILDLEIKSSFPSVKKTLHHIYDAETIWIQRINGVKNIKWPASAHFSGTLSDFEKVMITRSKEFAALVSDHDDSWLQSTINYSNIKGQPFSNVAWQIIMHVVNHSSYHRGQLVTMLREAGHTEFEQLDFIAWYR